MEGQCWGTPYYIQPRTMEVQLNSGQHTLYQYADLLIFSLNIWV